MTYKDVNGTEFTDEDIERWSTEAESPQGYTGAHLGPSLPGRPVCVGVEAKPFSIRLDVARRNKLTRIARTRGMSPSEVIRALIDELPDEHRTVS